MFQVVIKTLILVSLFSFSAEARSQKLTDRKFKKETTIDRYHRYLDSKWRKKTKKWNEILDGTEHVQFKSQDEAFAFYKDFSVKLAEVTGTPVAPLVLPNDPKYSQKYQSLTTQVQRLWKSYVELFPNQTAGLQSPPVILRKTDEPNAFVARELSGDKVIHAIFVNTALLDAPGATESQLLGVIAHEMAHSVFRHGLPKFGVRVEKYFDQTKSQAKYSYQAQNDPSAQVLAESWIGMTSSIGVINIPEMGKLPSIGSQGPTYFQLFMGLASGLPECANLEKPLTAWYGLAQVDGLSNTLHVPAKDRGTLKNLSTQIQDEFGRCASNQKIPLVDLLAGVFQVDPAFVAQNVDPKEIQLFDSQKTVAEGIFTVTSTIRKGIVELEQRPEFKNIASYTQEEHADDSATFVLMHAGLNPADFGRFFITMLGQDPIVAQCEALLSQKKTPPAGSLADIHRANCYRYDHIVKLSTDPQVQKDLKGTVAQFIQNTWTPKKAVVP